MLLDGRLEAAADGATFPVFNPATGEEIGRAPDATAADVDRAVAAARRALEHTVSGSSTRRWSTTDNRCEP
jgi:aldehyde dehydrogenase (NAD+)